MESITNIKTSRKDETDDARVHPKNHVVVTIPESNGDSSSESNERDEIDGDNKITRENVRAVYETAKSMYETLKKGKDVVEGLGPFLLTFASWKKYAPTSTPACTVIKSDLKAVQEAFDARITLSSSSRKKKKQEKKRQDTVQTALLCDLICSIRKRGKNDENTGRGKDHPSRFCDRCAWCDMALPCFDDSCRGYHSLLKCVEWKDGAPDDGDVSEVDSSLDSEMSEETLSYRLKAREFQRKEEREAKEIEDKRKKRKAAAANMKRPKKDGKKRKILHVDDVSSNDHNSRKNRENRDDVWSHDEEDEEEEEESHCSYDSIDMEILGKKSRRYDDDDSSRSSSDDISDDDDESSFETDVMKKERVTRSRKVIIEKRKRPDGSIETVYVEKKKK